MAHGGGRKAVVAALFANLGIAIGKFIGFAITRSSSMLAEGVHSMADTGNQALLLLGDWRAGKEATAQHPFGYGRERYFWAFAVSLVLFAGGSLFAIYEGINKIRHPHEIDNLGVALAILGAGIVLEGWSFRTAVKESNLVRGKHSWPAFIRHSRLPELPVVLLEDLGALVGLVIAFVAILFADLSGNAVWDGVGTLSIGILLGLIAIVLAIEMKSLLIGEGAVPEQREQLVAAIEAGSDVRHVIHMKTQHLGPEELLVATKIEFSHDLDIQGLAEAIDAAEARMRDAVPIARVIYVEPDIYEQGVVPAFDPRELDGGTGDQQPDRDDPSSVPGDNPSDGHTNGSS